MECQVVKVEGKGEDGAEGKVVMQSMVLAESAADLMAFLGERAQKGRLLIRR